MKSHDITTEEWFHIRTRRSEAMTGFSAHRTKSVPIKADDPTYVKGAGKTYHWSMGLQPDERTIKRIARRCPIKAAAAFLALYASGDHGNRQKPRLRRDPTGRPG